MKVLMFGWEFPPHNSGGLGVACAGLARGLANRGIGITFVLPKKVGVSADFLKIIFADISGIKFREIDSLLSAYATSVSYREIRSRTVSSIYGKGLFEEVMRYALRAYHLAKEEDFDLIHAHDWLSFGAGLAAKAASGKPLIVHVHATEFDRTGGMNINKRVYEIEKEGMEKADAVIAVSQFTKNIIVRHYGIDPNKINVVHNAVDIFEPGHFASELLELKRDGRKIVLFVGRITLQKGPDYFLQAAKKVLEYNSRVLFLVVGSGDMERQLIEQASSLGISDKVLFAGFLRDQELAKVYRVADLYVLPSVSEPFGITTLESLAHGTPVLISRQSGVAEVLSHALKVDFWDIDEMANKIVSVLAYAPLHACLRENGNTEVKKLSWGRSAEQCSGVYNEVMLRERAHTVIA
ncbi:MAG: glycosyltransferase family 4 protein [Patescibacteria group bacterium]